MPTITRFSVVLSIIAGCGSDTEPPKARQTVTASERQMLSSGMSLNCVKELRNSDMALLDAKFANDLATLSQMGVLTDVKPTVGPLGQTERVVADRRAARPNFPSPTVDILAQLDITIENELIAGPFNISDDMVRGAADGSYDRLGIASEGVRGWTLSFRHAEVGASTQLIPERKLAIVRIAPTEFLNLSNVEHELTHVLAGPSFTGNDKVVRMAQEFIAVVGETVDPGNIRDDLDYQRRNLAILGLGRSIDGEIGMLHARNAPLDGWRYDLLRATDEVIGEEGQIALAKRLYEQAEREGSLTLAQMQELFEEAGIRDLALFSQTIEPGLYLDLTFEKDGDPVILAKTIDQDGYEGISNVPMQIIWRSQENSALGGSEPMPLQPALGLDGGALMASYAAAIEVRVAGTPYIFQLEPRLLDQATTTSKPVPTLRAGN